MAKRTLRVLFVCTGNIDRSPTAEALLEGREGFEVQSAGTWINARRRISESLIDWADLIFAMEEHHCEAILVIKPEAANKIIVLNVPNEYIRNDPELVKTLKRKLKGYLKINW